jgi:hypothetical protein
MATSLADVVESSQPERLAGVLSLPTGPYGPLAADVTIRHTRRGRAVMAKKVLRLHLLSRLMCHAIGLIS